MRLGALTLVTALSVFVARGSFGAGDEQSKSEPARWHTRSSLVISASGDHSMNLIAGYTAIDHPHTFACKSSSGCLISFAPSIQLVEGSAFLWACGFVDGAQAKPKCATYDDDNVLSPRQHALVGQGEHTLQTMVYSEYGAGIVSEWETDYTIYELGN
ncbi:MAG TPA: hypothetical protein VKR31_07910 [Rhizomicrobium sp.]|nr:hypothetical protein [Rhizomicrobium sp.]